MASHSDHSKPGCTRRGSVQHIYAAHETKHHFTPTLLPHLSSTANTLLLKCTPMNKHVHIKAIIKREKKPNRFTQPLRTHMHRYKPCSAVTDILGLRLPYMNFCTVVILEHLLTHTSYLLNAPTGLGCQTKHHDRRNAINIPNVSHPQKKSNSSFRVILQAPTYIKITCG